MGKKVNSSSDSYGSDLSHHLAMIWDMHVILKVAVAFRKEKLETGNQPTVDGASALGIIFFSVRDPQSQREVKTERNDASSSFFSPCLHNAWASAALDLPSGTQGEKVSIQVSWTLSSPLQQIPRVSTSALKLGIDFLKASQEKIVPTIKHAPCTPDHSLWTLCTSALIALL